MDIIQCITELHWFVNIVGFPAFLVVGLPSQNGVFGYTPPQWLKMILTYNKLVFFPIQEDHAYPYLLLLHMDVLHITQCSCSVPYGHAGSSSSNHIGLLE